MGKNNAVPDAWDDEWEPQVEETQPEQPTSQPPRTKAERLAHHAETNRKIWESADSNQQTFHFVEANNTVPLTSAFKPQVKVLSRKPVVAKRDPVTGMAQLSVEDDEEEAPKDPQPTPEQIRARQKREREEKQRRYDEARAKIFGESAPSSGASSPGAVTPPRSDGRHTPQGRGRGRGNHRGNDSRQFDTRRTVPQSSSGRELYDPNSSSPRPETTANQRRGGDSEQPPRMSTPRDEPAIRPAVRAPRGPDGSGRGGFGFARRGNRET